eukprot:TRINITY_DN12056_c0_g1_i3.p2 TRINITY_DN12056_c0_g1~~TRINITY_DN12056_c0_g1_i3.p2  ORF type:complete len:399 (-),score=94.13 TRINITY_DN12056_c0_g1_i3:1368-2564(-)
MMCALPFDVDDDDEEDEKGDTNACSSNSISNSLSLSARKLLMKHREEILLEDEELAAGSTESLSMSSRKLLMHQQAPQAPNREEEKRRMSQPGHRPSIESQKSGASAGSLEGLSNLFVRQAAAARLQGPPEDAPQEQHGLEDAQSLFKIPLEHLAISWPTSRFELKNILKSAMTTAHQHQEKTKAPSLPDGTDRAPGGPVRSRSGSDEVRSRSDSNDGSVRSRSGSEGSGASSTAKTVSFAELPAFEPTEGELAEEHPTAVQPVASTLDVFSAPHVHVARDEPAACAMHQNIQPHGQGKGRGRQSNGQGNRRGNRANNPRLAHATSRIKQFAQKKDLHGAIAEMESAERSGDASDATAMVGLYNSLVGASVRCGNLPYARQVVQRMTDAGCDDAQRAC